MKPFAPGANPMHGRDKKGAIASLNSVAKLPYKHAEDGISYTFSIIPGALGKDDQERYKNLSAMMDGYFEKTGQHLKVLYIHYYNMKPPSQPRQEHNHL